MQVSIFYHFQKLEVKEKKLSEKNHEEKSGLLVQQISKQCSVRYQNFNTVEQILKIKRIK